MASQPPRYDAYLIAMVLQEDTTDRPPHVLCGIDHVRHMQQTRTCALEERDEPPTRTPRLLEPAIDEEPKGQLLALHNVFTMVGVKKMSSSCFATASVLFLKSHPNTGTRER
jgi:hypothetical protein